MTRVEFLKAVVDNAINEDVVAYAKERLEKENERKSTRATESAEKREVALQNLVSEPQTAAEIAEGTGYSARTIQYYLGVLVKEGIAVKGDNGKVKTYKLA